MCGFELGRGYELDAFDNDCTDVGLVLAACDATWDGAPFGEQSYAVSVHRRTGRSD